VALGIRGFLVLGSGPDYSGQSDQFKGWGALLDARVHTGSWLERVRFELALDAGLGREVAAGRSAPEEHTFEFTTTGFTVAAALAVRLRVSSVLVGIELSPFYWGGHATSTGSGFANPNDGLGALLMLSLSYELTRI